MHNAEHSNGHCVQSLNICMSGSDCHLGLQVLLGFLPEPVINVIKE
jgi:hypothetical protein